MNPTDEESDNPLKGLIEATKPLLFAPLIAGSFYAANHLSTNNYLLAIQVATSGALITAILLSTLLFLNYLIIKINNSQNS